MALRFISPHLRTSPRASWSPMSLAGQGGKGVLEKRVDGVVFLAEDVRGSA